MLAITGPTAAGKTALAVELAQRFGGEIVNADSRQVFRGLDIGSAKPPPAERGGVPHHLFDVVDPDQHFDVARYRELALAAIRDIDRRGRRVILVGGTGLYIKVIRGGLFEGPPRDAELRERLKAAEAAEPGSLYRRLQAVDPASAARLHPNDLLRLVRAIEVFERTGRPISDWQREHAFADRELAMQTLAVTLPRPELYRRIDCRCQQMIAAGLIDEVRGLLGRGYDPQQPALQSPGYREIGDFLAGRCDLSAAVAQMAQATRRLAKRQLTWTRGDREARWIEPAQAEESARLWWGSEDGGGAE